MWPADWQRHYATVPQMVVEESVLVYVEPGVTVHGMDIGRWLARQRKHDVWHGLTDGQREHLEQLGITSLTPKPEAPAKPSTTPVSTFERGVAAPGGVAQGPRELCEGSQGPRRAT